MNTNEQSKNITGSEPLHDLELKANLNPQQRKYLELLKDKMKKVLGGKTKQELAKVGDLALLEKYKSVLSEILEFLRTKKANIDKNFSFKTAEELEAVYGPEQIAHNKDEVNEETKVYIGELYPEIFKDLPGNIDHIYTSFPEGKIMQKEIIIGGKSATGLKKSIKEKGYYSNHWIENKPVDDMMASEDFKPLKKKRKLDLVVLSLADLGFPSGVSYIGDLYEQAKKLGLEIMPPEVGPQLRLQYEDQPNGEYLFIGTERLSVGNHSYVFIVRHDDESGRCISFMPAHVSFYNNAYKWVFARPA